MDEKIKKLAEQNANIPTVEIERDIRDTELEIADMTKEAEHLEATPLSMNTAKMDHYRATARRSGIKERQEFVEKLKLILEYRKHGNP